MQILLVGKSSYLGREFVARNPDLSVRVIGHADVVREEMFAGADCVINFAFAPALYESEYDRSKDIDDPAARAAHKHGAHYLMLSSRRVYVADSQWNANEESEATGRDAYGRNKARIERNLENLLHDKLTVVRPGSVVGYEAIPGRQRIAAYMQNQLLQDGRIRLTVAERTRRDLVPIGFFCRALRKIAMSRMPGIFNIGSGRATAVGDAARWLIEGFGAGEIIGESPLVVDEFQLDCTKLFQALGLSCGPEELEADLRESGARLARQRNPSLD